MGAELTDNIFPTKGIPYNCMKKQNQPNKKNLTQNIILKKQTPQEDYEVLLSEKFGFEAEKFPAKVLHPTPGEDK